MTTTIPGRPASWFSNALSALSSMLRRPHPDATASSPKLEPIAHIVSRAGREHAESK